MLVSRLIAAKPPPPPASQTPETRFVRYQNRYLGWTACHELLKHIPHALAHLIAAKPSQEQPNAGRQQGFAAIRCAGLAVCGFWPPSWLENPHAYPDSSFDSVQTLSKGLGNVDRRGVCMLSDVRLLLGVGASTAQNDSRIDSCETGFGAEGFRSYQM